MGVRLVVAVTDGDWFDHLRAMPHLTEVNFWSPSDRTFRALEPGEPLLFKLHAPRNFVVGGGNFAHATTLPCSVAWEAFGEENGAATLREMRARIAKYTKQSPEDRSDFHVGCRILTQPFFVTDNYHRMCAVTRERTLPALEAAHIKPFAEGGEHEASNGVLPRRDIHSLFDAGYVTITPTLNFEVSRRIKENSRTGGSTTSFMAEPSQRPTIQGASRIAQRWRGMTRTGTWVEQHGQRSRIGPPTKSLTQLLLFDSGRAGGSAKTMAAKAYAGQRVRCAGK